MSTLLYAMISAIIFS